MNITVEQFYSLFNFTNCLFVGVSCLGMVGHAVKKYLSNELSGTIIQYLFINDYKRSVLAVMTTLGATLMLILGNQLPDQIGAFLLLAFTTGYTADSTVNKDS